MSRSKIEWLARPGTVPESWSPVTGCTKISEGCENCYAERMARRLAGRYSYPEAPHHFDVTLRPERLEQPLKWRKPRTVFVCSMSDLFHMKVTQYFIEEVFRVIARSPKHTFLILTKRARRMQEYMEYIPHHLRASRLPNDLHNVWLGVTAENQQAADERIPLLLQTPAAVRFVSVEPMLGMVDLRRYLWCVDCEEEAAPCGPCLKSGQYDGPKLDWIIVGGESGPGARPAQPDWFRRLRDQCQAAGVPFFFKQWGAWAHIPGDTKYPIPQKTHWWPDRNLMARVGKKAAGRLLDGREWNEWPEVKNV